MRIVVFSNLYPPLFVGGYEIGAARVVTELGRRGHTVQVLTAHEYHVEDGRAWQSHRHTAADRAALVDVGPCVLGSLLSLARRAPWRLPRLWLLARQARHRYRALLEKLRPDLVLLFNPLGVLAPVVSDCIALARRQGAAVRAYVSDPWLQEWPTAQPCLRLLTRCGLARPARPQADLNLFCSRYLQHTSGGSGRVVPWGVAAANSLPCLPARHFQAAEPLTLVFAGQIQPHKGLQVLLRALARCRKPHRLVVLGEDNTSHASHCKKLAGELGLGQRCTFLGRQPPEEMPVLLRRLGQVLVVPSVWQEPFSLVVLEGMTAGLPVVASNTGGTGEAITAGRTGFFFDVAREQTLTDILDRLEADRLLCHRVGSQARDEARQRFTMEQMVNQLLAPLQHVPAAELTAGSAAEVLPCTSC